MEDDRPIAMSWMELRLAGYVIGLADYCALVSEVDDILEKVNQ